MKQTKTINQIIEYKDISLPFSESHFQYDVNGGIFVTTDKSKEIFHMKQNTSEFIPMKNDLLKTKLVSYCEELQAYVIPTNQQLIMIYNHNDGEYHPIEIHENVLSMNFLNKSILTIVTPNSARIYSLSSRTYPHTIRYLTPWKLLHFKNKIIVLKKNVGKISGNVLTCESTEILNVLKIEIELKENGGIGENEMKLRKGDEKDSKKERNQSNSKEEQKEMNEIIDAGIVELSDIIYLYIRCNNCLYMINTENSNEDCLRYECLDGNIKVMNINNALVINNNKQIMIHVDPKNIPTFLDNYPPLFPKEKQTLSISSRDIIKPLIVLNLYLGFVPTHVINNVAFDEINGYCQSYTIDFQLLYDLHLKHVMLEMNDFISHDELFNINDLIQQSSIENEKTKIIESNEIINDYIHESISENNEQNIQQNNETITNEINETINSKEELKEEKEIDKSKEEINEKQQITLEQLMKRKTQKYQNENLQENYLQQMKELDNYLSSFDMKTINFAIIIFQFHYRQMKYPICDVILTQCGKYHVPLHIIHKLLIFVITNETINYPIERALNYILQTNTSRLYSIGVFLEASIICQMYLKCKINESLQLRMIFELSELNDFETIQRFLHHRLVSDTHPIAIALGHSKSELMHSYCYDMLKRLGEDDELIKMLIKHNKLVDAVRYARKKNISIPQVNIWNALAENQNSHIQYQLQWFYLDNK